MRQMSGLQDGSPLQALITHRLNAASDQETAMQAEAGKALAAIFKPVQELKGGLTHKQHIPEIGKSLSRAGRMAVMLNLGNPVNRQRLMDGQKWGPKQVEAIAATLSPTELQAINELWAHLDSYAPAISAQMQLMDGKRLEKVEPSPFTTIASDGSVVSMRGGYYPIVYNTAASQRAEQLDSAQVAKDMMRGAFTRSTTRRGHTKQRVEEVKRELLLNLEVPGRHITQVIHDLSFRAALADTTRLLRHGLVDSAVRDHYGAETVRAIKDHLNAVAAGTGPQRDTVDKFIGFAMANTTRMTLGLSFSTALAQVMGLSATAARVGIGPTIRGAASVLGNPARIGAAQAAVREASTFMRHRLDQSDRELNRAANLLASEWPAMQKLGEGRDKILFYMLNKVQGVVDLSTWVAAHDKALAAGVTEANAVAQADAAVRESQSDGHMVSKSSWQVNHPGLLIFGSAMNAVYNVWAEKAGRTVWSNPASVASFLGTTALIAAGPAILQAFLIGALRGSEPPEDLEAWLAAKGLSGILGMFPLLREFSGILDGHNYSGTPITKFITVTGRTGGHIMDRDTEALAKDLIDLTGLFGGLPVVQFNRSVKGAAAADAGEAPPTAILFGAPGR